MISGSLSGNSEIYCAVSGGENLPLLEIYRLELVFMNPAEARWQMFQYGAADAKGSAVYRYQAQCLLEFVHQSLAKYEVQHPGVIRMTQPNLGSDMIELNIAKLRSKLRRIAADEYGAWIGEIKDNLLITLRGENLESAAKFIEDNIFNGLANEDTACCRLTRQQALTLISALYCARRWDIFGKLSFPKSRADSRPAPALFSYEIGYCEARPSIEAEKALEYGVKIGIQWNDKDAEEANYFGDFCADVIKGREAFWYCFYGVLLDWINTSLAGENPTDTPVGPVQIVCFPLQICGYDHFLQLYVRQPDKGTGRLTLADIQAATNSAFNEADYSGAKVKTTILLKECLRDLLVQIHIAAFQHCIENHLKSLREDETEVDVLQRDELFCQHAPNLVRMVEMLTRETHFVYKADEHHPRYEQWLPVVVRGKKAKICAERLAKQGYNYVELESRLMAIVPWDERYKGYLEPLFAGTGLQRLREQYQWLKGRVDLHNLAVVAK